MYYESLIVNFFELINILILVNKIVYNTKIRLRMPDVLKFIVLWGMSSYVLYLKLEISQIITLILIFLFIKIYINKNIKEALNIFVISFICQASIQVIIIFLTSIFVKDFTNEVFIFELFLQTLFTFVTILICKFVPLNKLSSTSVLSDKLYISIIVCVFILFIILIIWGNYNFNTLLNNIIIIAVIASILMFMLLNAFINISKLKYQEKKLKLQEKSMENTNILINKILEKQHGFDNKINTISGLAETCKDYEELSFNLKSYSDLMINDLKQTAILKIHNQIISGFLYYKYNEGLSKGMDISLVIDNYLIGVDINSYDLVEALGILIDNAYEAGDMQKRVIIRLENEKEKIIAFSVLNKHPKISDSLKEKLFEEGFSTKEKDHKRGYGLFIIGNMVREGKFELVFDNIDIDGENYVCFSLII